MSTFQYIKWLSFWDWFQPKVFNLFWYLIFWSLLWKVLTSSPMYAKKHLWVFIFVFLLLELWLCAYGMYLYIDILLFQSCFKVYFYFICLFFLLWSWQTGHCVPQFPSVILRPFVRVFVSDMYNSHLSSFFFPLLVYECHLLPFLDF